MIVNAGDTTEIRWCHSDPETEEPVEPATTTATLRAPDGSSAPLTVQHPDVGVAVVAVATPTPGDWVLTWASTGPDEVDEIAMYATPPGLSAPWAPTLRTVGAHVPDRTRRIYSDNEPSGTFNDQTTPDGDTVVVLIGSAVAWVTSVVGTPILPAAYPACLNAAALWAAYWVERSYPSDATNQAVQLRTDAEQATAAAKAFNTGIGGGGDQTPDADGVPDQLVTFGGFDPAPYFPPAGSYPGGRQPWHIL